jgi:serine/threonine protein kinase
LDATDRGDWLEMHTLLQQPAEDSDNDGNDGNGDVDVAATAAAASRSRRIINESDVEKVRVAGRGTFGEVWEGILHPEGQRVAIKYTRAAVVDDDGDVVDTCADENFRKECDALQRIDSPHLLKFFGFGTTASGGMFIVTELLVGGSLYDVLQDPRCGDLPWRTRAKIALQVALGMKHLHERHMLHRDLKSANVLLDEEMRAKVCDFGLSRVVRPARQRVVHSPFTGMTRLLPSADGVHKINDGQQSVLSLENLAVNVVDARGIMTRAAGTLLWMAPEVFRGDQDYTGAIDVYSYGIVMWELATRKKPWVDELSHETVFFEQLNRALQTGRRPAIPDDVAAEHGEYVAVMQRCWAGDSIDRPTFADVSNDLFFYLFK